MLPLLDDKKPLRVMLIHDDPARAETTKLDFDRLNFDTTCIAFQALPILKEISEQTPDTLIIDIPSPARDIFECLAIVSAHQPIPIVMFSNHQEPEYITEALDAGVSSYLVGSINTDTIQAIVTVAFAQFKRTQNLNQILEQTRSQLLERNHIDKAKVVVMRTLKVDETQAYKHLRNEAMNCGLSIAAVSKKIMDATAT